MLFSTTRLSTVMLPSTTMRAALRILPAWYHYKPRISHQQVRNHLSHAAPSTTAVAADIGPRQPVRIGLDATKHSSNILRLLESSHGPHAAAYDTFSTAYHPQGLLWRRKDNDWKATSVEDLAEGETDTYAASSASRQEQPQLASMTMSDDRTALVKLRGVDGMFRYLSLLRFDPDFAPAGRMNLGVIANDGWFIVREIVSSPSTKKGDNTQSTTITEPLAALQSALSTYFSIEHGGGAQDRAKAESLFAPQASLLSIGSSAIEDEPSDWSAPVGSLLEIPFQTYLDGVSSQTPHSDASSSFDGIHTVDICGDDDIAAVTLQVGNGTQTNVFVDHLLLGRNHKQNDWQILSKTFSPQSWPGPKR